MRDEARQKLQRVHGLRARRRPVALVRAILHRRGGLIVLQAVTRHGVPRATPREALRELQVPVRDPHAVVLMKPGVRPREHALGVIGLEDPASHKEPEHRADP